MLSHYARLIPWVPFYVATLDPVTKKPSAKYYRNVRSNKFNIEVVNNLIKSPPSIALAKNIGTFPGCFAFI